jgi:hypothetical protein
MNMVRKRPPAEKQARDGSGAHRDKRKDGEASIEYAAESKGTLELRMALEQEGKMACSKVVGHKATTRVEEVIEAC